MLSASASHRPADEQQEELQTRALLNDITGDAIERQLLFPSARQLRGFSRHQSHNQQQFSVQTDAGAFFVKCLDQSLHHRLVAEQESLLRIMETQTITVCAPLALGSIQRPDMPSVSYLILQHIPLAVHGDWFSAGQQVAQMHTHTSSHGYGFDMPTWCGNTRQDNRWQSDWCDFFTAQRLQPLFDQLRAQGTDIAHQWQALEYSCHHLHGHQPAASLLHGDLWSGNIGFNPDKKLSYPVLFDPSGYYGDAESDLAMTELFGRFPKKFYDGYQSVRMIDDDYPLRRPVYQLYHLLNHALLFGGSYIPQAENLTAQMKL